MNLFDKPPMTVKQLDAIVAGCAKVAAWSMALAVAIGWACKIVAWWK